MGTPRPQKINRYGVNFKLKAVLKSTQPVVLIRDVAESLYIHPFILSKSHLPKNCRYEETGPVNAPGTWHPP